MESTISAYLKFCSENDILNDDGLDGQGTSESRANAQTVFDYFHNQWKQPMTDENLDKAKHVLLPLLTKFETPQHREYAGLSSESRRLFAEWRPSSGLADTMQNANAILGWLKAHNLTPTKEHFVLAQGQTRVQHFLEYSYQSKPKDARSHSGEVFADDDMVFTYDNNGKINGRRRKTFAEWKKEQDEKAAAAQTQAPEQPKDAWTKLVQESLRQGPHSEQAACKAEYDKAISLGKSQRDIYTILDQVHRSYSKPVDRARF